MKTITYSIYFKCAIKFKSEAWSFTFRNVNAYYETKANISLSTSLIFILVYSYNPEIACKK